MCDVVALSPPSKRLRRSVGTSRVPAAPRWPPCQATVARAPATTRSTSSAGSVWSRRTPDPTTPPPAGLIERFQQTMKKWLHSQPGQPGTIAELQTLIDAFVEEYNHHDRPHRRRGHRRAPARAHPRHIQALPRHRPTTRAHTLKPRTAEPVCWVRPASCRKASRGWLVELAGIEPASSSVEPGLLRVQSVMSLFSAPALALTRRRQAQSGKVPITPP